MSSQARGEQVAFAIERGHPKRRACERIGVARSTLLCERRLPLRDAPVLEAMRRLAQQYPRYGYRRIRIVLNEIAHIDPGKPWQNGTDESFNGRLRDACLSLEWFRFRLEARVIIEPWRRHYDEVRPHSSLDYRTPAEFRQHHDSL